MLSLRAALAGPLLLLLLATAAHAAADDNEPLAPRISSIDPPNVPKGVILGTGDTVGYGELAEEWRGEIITLSWSPRAFLVKGLLSDSECDHLIAMASDHMTKSTVVDSATGKSKDSEVRTSTGTFLSMAQDDVVRRIEKRVAQVTMLPVSHQEGLQVLHYQNGQKYEPHFDYFHDAVNTAPDRGGQRVLTMLMYLTTPDEGGETVFPSSEVKMSGPEWSDCAKKGLAVKAFRGDAIMFYSLHPDGTLDPASLHGSCPTLKGNKWSATKWIHVNPIAANVAKPVQTGCADNDPMCREWMVAGECDKNPAFMHTSCRKACKMCFTNGAHASAAGLPNA